MNENHVVKQDFEEPCAVVPQARICGSTGGVIPGATRPETQENTELTMRRIARMLGNSLVTPWKSVRGDRNEPSAFRQMIDRKMRQPNTEKSYFFPE